MYPNCMPDVLILAEAVLQIFCWQSCFTIKCQSRKREIIQPNIYRLLPKVNQVIYTMATVYMPNIMILAQAVIQIWAATWQNQQNECAPSEDSDQPWHPPSLIRVFAVRMKKACVLSYPLSAQRRLWSD